MTLIAISDSLEASMTSGREAEELDRMSFLEWLFTVPDNQTPSDAAFKSMQLVHMAKTKSEALQYFARLMECACRPLPAPRRKRRHHENPLSAVH
jgi:hypothetical protein